MNRPLLSPIGLLASFHMMAPGAEPPAPDARLVLPELVQEAFENNPEIRAAEQRIEAARAVIPQVRTLPDPTINFGYRDLSEREMMYGATQEIPFPVSSGCAARSPHARPTERSRSVSRPA